MLAKSLSFLAGADRQAGARTRAGAFRTPTQRSA
jgi:hypothetical protein